MVFIIVFATRANFVPVKRPIPLGPRVCSKDRFFFKWDKETSLNVKKKHNCLNILEVLNPFSL